MGHIKVARWKYNTGNLWGIFKNRHLSNAIGRIRDESLMNLGGPGLCYYKNDPLMVNVTFKADNRKCV
jgi:hypothetical protein